MAASSILKWQYSLRVGKSSLQNTTRGFLYIRKWKNSTELDKSKKNKYNIDVIVNIFFGVSDGGGLLLCLLQSVLYSRFYMSWAVL